MELRARQPFRGAHLNLEGQNSRLRMGLTGRMGVRVIWGWLVAAGAGWGWRLLSFFLIFFAAMGVWQGATVPVAALP